MVALAGEHQSSKEGTADAEIRFITVERLD
jgi:hypothetical protein